MKWSSGRSTWLALVHLGHSTFEKSHCLSTPGTMLESSPSRREKEGREGRLTGRKKCTGTVKGHCRTVSEDGSRTVKVTYISSPLTLKKLWTTFSNRRILKII